MSTANSFSTAANQNVGSASRMNVKIVATASNGLSLRTPEITPRITARITARMIAPMIMRVVTCSRRPSAWDTDALCTSLPKLSLMYGKLPSKPTMCRSQSQYRTSTGWSRCAWCAASFSDSGVGGGLRARSGFSGS